MKASNPRPRWLSGIIIGSKDRIMDCGCGTGLFLERVASYVQLALAVDLSLKMLRRPKLRLGQKSNVDHVCANFDYLPFCSSIFRFVFVFTVPRDPVYSGSVIGEALRELDWGGIVTLSISNKESSKELLLKKLRMIELQPQELIDKQTVLDYLIISARSGALNELCSSAS